jgi:hypothetical protein
MEQVIDYSMIFLFFFIIGERFPVFFLITKVTFGHLGTTYLNGPFFTRWQFPALF